VTDLPGNPAAARRAIDAGEVTAVELTEAALECADRLTAATGAFVELTPEIALAQARVVDRELGERGRSSALQGLPFGVKDTIDVGRVVTSGGTRGAGQLVVERVAPVVVRLVRAGAVAIGKTATHELALGMVTPAARNPRDPSRITGGSSGGSAAAVAAGAVAFALGTDTNGSVRCPAALCGVAGLKPARGSLPLDGVWPLAPSQDTVGVLAGGAGELRAIWAELGGSERVRSPARVGVDTDAFETADPEVCAIVLEAVDRMADGGAEIVRVRLPDTALAGAASLLAIVAEAGAAWAGELEANPGGFSPGVRGALKAHVPARAYDDAKRVRALIGTQLRELFERHRLGALALPTTPLAAPEIGRDRVELRGRLRSVDGVQSQFLALASLTGQPAVSVPCGTSAAGLPVGLQLLGRSGGEDGLLELAATGEILLCPSTFV
jgi:aspartyl-tRNA(Asn)/glutamyl-tRNA(Gln) amidotransferase subunit A